MLQYKLGMDPFGSEKGTIAALKIYDFINYGKTCKSLKNHTGLWS